MGGKYEIRYEDFNNSANGYCTTIYTNSFIKCQWYMDINIFINVSVSRIPFKSIYSITSYLFEF